MLATSGACERAPRASDTVVIASGADLESANPLVTIHPLARQVQRFALFVTLARLDEHLLPQPYFARAWHFSADRRALTFDLVPSLRWDDGTPTAARDVAFTLDAARDPATGFPRASDLAELTRVSADDDSTVTLHFAAAQPRFPEILAELPIVPAHRLASVQRAAMRADSFAVHPIGNGPFRFVKRVAGQRWELARNDSFPISMGGPPLLRRVIIAIIDEAATKFAGLTSGELDLAGISPAMAPLVARDPLLRVIDYPVLQSYGIVFNVARAPFADVRVRRALSLAIDRRRIVAVAVHGYGEPSSEAIPSTHPYGSAAAPVQDTATADSLLDAAGWRRGASGLRERGGHPLAFELLTVGSSDNAAEQLIQSDLARVGARVEIRQREMASFLAAARASPRAFDVLYTGVPGDLSLSHLSAMFDSRFAGGALDYGTFHEPRLDSLLRAASVAPDSAARARWSAVERELDATMPVAWIYHARGVQGASRRLEGVTMDLRGELVALAAWRARADSTESKRP
ncbi:MAG TPA: peptide ABC transporter substrate-binding protein [Gemmatimonadaceae bacterium]|nr:peptide ABC transporter substrate-binding protein [Gemmatimonadaceae bacterium]